jgi:ferric-dicitrate binding protein FerR (iron transport regulator)
MTPREAAEEALRQAIALDGAAVDPEVGRRMQARIAERLEQRNARRRPGFVMQLLVATASAAVGAVLVASFAHLRQREPLPIAVTRGQVELLNAHGGPVALASGEGVPVGAELSTAGEAAALALGPGAVAALSSGSRLRIVAPQAVELVDGEVGFQVIPRAADPLFVVTAGECRVRVAGARFTVALGGGAVLVAVSEGAVRVEREGKAVEVPAAGRWSSLPPPQQEEKVSLVEQAARLLEAGDVPGARALYEQLSAEPGTNGELGLYYLARLESARLKDPAAALGALEQMERRYPDGALRREGLLSKIEALDALGRHGEARHAAEQYAKSYPGSGDVH